MQKTPEEVLIKEFDTGHSYDEICARLNKQHYGYKKKSGQIVAWDKNRLSRYLTSLGLRRREQSALTKPQKFCQQCNKVLEKDRLYERHCSWACRNADRPATENFAMVRLSESEMLDLCVAIAGRKSQLLLANRERDLEEWEMRLWANLSSVDDKCSHQLMRMNASYENEGLRVIKGEKS